MDYFLSHELDDILLNASSAEAGAPWPDDMQTLPESLLPKGDAAPAKGANHWAFQPLERPAVPALPAAQAGLGKNPIDAFILASLEAKGLAPSPEADRRTLLRRLSLANLARSLPSWRLSAARMSASPRSSTPSCTTNVRP